ncbi:MAG: DNA-binding protein [Actinomycetes bacterium]
MNIFRRQRSDSPVVEESVYPLIASLTPRSKTAIRGRVVRIVRQPTQGLPTLLVRIEDASGAATAVWLGRRSIGGLDLGRTVVIEGVPMTSATGLRFLNPAYTLLP